MRDFEITGSSPSWLSENGKMSRLTSASIVPTTSPSGVGRPYSSIPAVLVWSLTYVVFLFSRIDIADPDLWWHLRNAQYLLTRGHLPVVDSYSYTAAGAAVFPFEWLSEIPYYLAYKLAGLPAVFLLVFLLCTAIVLGIFRLSYLASNDVMSSFLVTVGGAILTKVSIGARTLLFGWLYLVVLLLILEAVRRGGWKWLWLVPPLFCIWVNSHGSWPMGMVVFGIFIASGLVEGCWGHAYATRWSGPQLRRLLITAGASAVAVFVNPFGYRIVFYPFKVMFGADSSGLGIIQEFASIDFHTPLGKAAMVLILGTLLIAVFSQERWRLDELGFIMLALYFSLTNVRFMFLAGILAPPIFAKRLKLVALDRDSDQRLNNAVALIPHGRNSDKRLRNAVVFVILCYVFIVSAPRHWKFQSPINYPEGAVAYMKTNGIQGRVFHDWDWGGYLIWHMPELKVFIDSRGDPYGPTGVFKDYWSAISNKNPQAVLDKYQVEYVLMPTDSQLSKFLKSSPRWAQLYSDETSVLLHRTPTSRPSQ
jgi:hypothetical protein